MQTQHSRMPAMKADSVFPQHTWLFQRFSTFLDAYT